MSGAALRYLFDTDALSLAWKPRPLAVYQRWAEGIPQEDQYTSAVTVGELFKGAYRRREYPHLLARIEGLLAEFNILAYDTEVARTYGILSAELERAGTPLEDADLQIAATAVHHGLVLVTGNVKHYSRVPGLKFDDVIVRARASLKQ